ncbi:MAG TPA: hypothetical protein VMS40_23380 [Vicinamibacterales bacterium]|nr:hypothetical protein [Vicinamibacterales bacterium]
MPTIRNAFEALLDDAKERVKRLEVVEVLDRRRHDWAPSISTPAQFAGAKSASLIGGPQ